MTIRTTPDQLPERDDLDAVQRSNASLPRTRVCAAANRAPF